MFQVDLGPQYKKYRDVGGFNLFIFPDTNLSHWLSNWDSFPVFFVLIISMNFGLLQYFLGKFAIS